MKNKFLFLILFILPNIYLKAQVTLEHTYYTSDYAWVSVAKISPSEWNYYHISGSNLCNIYSFNHSFLKSVTLTIPSSASPVITARSLSKNLLTTDNKYVIGYYYIDTVLNVQALRFIEDDGTILLTVDSVVDFTIYNTSQGTKMLVRPAGNYGITSNRIYSLPGTYYSLNNIKNLDDNNGLNAFPNPTINMIHLPYNLSNSDHGTMFITNNLGQIIEQYEIDRTFNDLLFDASELRSGNYFYYVISDNVKSETKRFIKD